MDAMQIGTKNFGKQDKRLIKLRVFRSIVAAAGVFLGMNLPGAVLSAQAGATPQSATYADLADLADGADLVLRAEIRKQAALKPERAPDVPLGMVRLYIEARTISLLSGNAPVGESLRYLVDVPLTASGKVPKLKKSEVILFSHIVANRAGELRLVSPTAQLVWNAELETRLRSILSELLAPDAPPAITEIREALSIAGNLTGESETQIFVATKDDGPVSLTVIRRPAQKPIWGVSWSEIVDQAARPPAVNTLEWYRLACFFPRDLPRSANLSGDRVARQRAIDDYRFILEQLGPCPRNRS